jgi:MFS superfamily sulfate permease-like transporter
MELLTIRETVRRDFLASVVVFLVALPLCIGVAVASGVPPELGLVTGIVGGLVAGAMPGSSLPVSGPAAGLTVLVYEAVHTHGLRILGVVVVAAGLAQLAMGALRLGRWFRAISISVVEGMLAGIGLVLLAGQVHTLFDGRSPGAALANLAALFSAAAVDRMHDGPRTHYDRELIAQGAGNTVCGLLGALPMTAVIVRSAANVQAGARTKASRILHGWWLLAFTVLAPAALTVIPVTALAAVLVHAGWKLLSLRDVGRLWRTERGEAVVLTGTALGIVVTNLFEGVLIGMLLAVAKTAWDVSDIHLDVQEGDGKGPIKIMLTGNATFLRLPRVLDTLEAIPHGRPVELDLSRLRHLDHACRTALLAWAAQHGGRDDTSVKVSDVVVTP